MLRLGAATPEHRVPADDGDVTSLPPGHQPAVGAPPAPAGPPPGWHSDPWGTAEWRWWDGRQWTPYVWPMPWGSPAPATRMRNAFWPAMGLMVASIVAGIVAALPLGIVATILGDESTAITATVAVFYPVAFAGFWWSSRLLSRRFGTGDMRVDFGWRRFRKADLGWGALAGIGAVVAQGLVGLVFTRPADDSYREAVFGTDPGVVMLVVMAFAVVIGAPLFEELLFRGPVMRSLVDRFGAVTGVILQGAVFALYHIVGDPRLATLWYLMPLFVVGVIFGAAAQRTGRMATSQVAHAVMNLIAFVALVATL